nr:cyclin A/B/D/E [Tanacetum cinerariifolium]
MNKENVPVAKMQQPTARITRARAKALGISGGLPPQHPLVKKVSNQVLQPNTKRGSSDDKSTDVGSGFQSKRRSVLKEVTNMPFNDLNVKVINEVKILTSKQMRSVADKKAMVAPAVYVGP